MIQGNNDMSKIERIGDLEIGQRYIMTSIHPKTDSRYRNPFVGVFLGINYTTLVYVYMDIQRNNNKNKKIPTNNIFEWYTYKKI